MSTVVTSMVVTPRVVTPRVLASRVITQRILTSSIVTSRLIKPRVVTSRVVTPERYDVSSQVTEIQDKQKNSKKYDYNKKHNPTSGRDRIYFAKK